MPFVSSRQRRFVMRKLRNRDVADYFVQNRGDAEGSNMFIEGDTIYSYGHHFPIAKRLPDGTFLFTNKGRSMTTSRHKNYVKRALQGYNVKYVDEVN